MSGASTLDPDNFPQKPDRSHGTGHGTDALGPSDTSDSGSDVVGGPGFALGIDDDQMPGLERNTSEDGEDGETGSGSGTIGAGPDMGDSDLDSDSDSGGTGERASAGRDTSVRDGADIDTDSIQSFDVPLTDEDIDFLASSPLRNDKDSDKGKG